MIGLWLLVWISVLLYLWMAWGELSPYIKYPLAALEAIFCPDEDMFKLAIRGKVKQPAPE